MARSHDSNRRGDLGSTAPQSDVTRLLLAWHHGDRDAFNRLIHIVHDELYRTAARYMRRERRDHSLQPTALVNEAYLRLLNVDQIDWQDRAHFLAMAARIMRRILVDHSRRRGFQKRGAGLPRVTFSEDLPVGDERSADVVRLNDALDALEQIDRRKSRVVELRFFGGLSVAETAAVLHVSPDTVARDWRLAKAWVRRHLREH
jgi:RNA polymerase sigma factor (TIGR02999 family)